MSSVRGCTLFVPGMIMVHEKVEVCAAGRGGEIYWPLISPRGGSVNKLKLWPKSLLFLLRNNKKEI